MSRPVARKRMYANLFLLGCFSCRRQAEIASAEGAASSFASTVGSASSHKATSSLAQLSDALAVRCGLNGWVCACVRFTEQLRAVQANVRFVLLDAQVTPRLFVQVMPVLQVVQSLVEPLAHAPFHPTQSRDQLASVGSFQNLLRRNLQDIMRHGARPCVKSNG